MGKEPGPHRGEETVLTLEDLEFAGNSASGSAELTLGECGQEKLVEPGDTVRCVVTAVDECNESAEKEFTRIHH